MLQLSSLKLVPTMQDYAYYSIDEYCNKNREDRTVVSIDSYEDVPTNNEAKLAQAVTAQPVSVAICASQLQFYSSGGASYFWEQLTPHDKHALYLAFMPIP